ncbi:MAG: hypothetical protein J1G30_09920 [Spirochaetales bacterium]|nr:hypothetical protein [Spirochaetales bacterium]
MCSKKTILCFIQIIFVLLAFVACSSGAQVNTEYSTEELKTTFLKIEEELPEALMNDEFDAFIEKFGIWEKKFNAFKIEIAGKVIPEQVQRDIDFLNIEVRKINMLKELTD